MAEWPKDWRRRYFRRHVPESAGRLPDRQAELLYLLKRSSRLPYDVYIRMMRAEIGERLIDNCDGRDVARWFEAWSAPAATGGSRQVAKARMAIAVLKAALTFGIMCRKPGCPEFRAVIDAMRFEGLPSRKFVLTADQISAAREATRAAGHPGAALAYAIQFEGAVRQWDVIGQWLPLEDRQPSAVIYKGKKWIGPTWAHVDANLILRFMPTKTENTTAPEIVIDLQACPMVMEELQDVPPAARTGPRVIDRITAKIALTRSGAPRRPQPAFRRVCGIETCGSRDRTKRGDPARISTT